jgi:antitoxin MazE
MVGVDYWQLRLFVNNPDVVRNLESKVLGRFRLKENFKEIAQKIYKSRLRGKGQVTIPGEFRERLSAEEGDDLVFRVDEGGRILIERAITIPADQVWFWSERWQRLEREAQEDIDGGRVRKYPDIDQAITDLQ